MDVSELIREFSSRNTLPVDVNDVLSCLRKNGSEQDIEFIGVDLDIDVLQGLIKTFYGHSAVYGDPQVYVNIYYHKGHTIDWQRMVCCKELIHLLDPDSAVTRTKEQIEQLAEKIGLPPEMQDPTSDGFATNVDRVAEWRAAAILLPWEARKILLPAYKDGLITISDIARLADVPRKYVGFVMSDIWEQVFPLLV